MWHSSNLIEIQFNDWVLYQSIFQVGDVSLHRRIRILPSEHYTMRPHLHRKPWEENGHRRLKSKWDPLTNRLTLWHMCSLHEGIFSLVWNDWLEGIPRSVIRSEALGIFYDRSTYTVSHRILTELKLRSKMVQQAFEHSYKYLKQTGLSQRHEYLACHGLPGGSDDEKSACW